MLGSIRVQRLLLCPYGELSCCHCIALGILVIELVRLVPVKDAVCNLHAESFPRLPSVEAVRRAFP